jgi:intracellular sulfur oxidation DsrE/DsrF family protein
MSLSRRHFVAAAALGASAAALRGSPAFAASAGAKPHFHILRANEYDHAGMMRILTQRKPHKQVFQDSGTILLVPGVVSAYIHMQNSLNAHEFSLGFGRGSLATLAVLMGPAIVLGLDDAMWKKYGFGSAFKLAPTNLYYRASSNLQLSAEPDDPNGIYQDWSAQAVLHRGGAFMVCHNAMTFVASITAAQTGRTTAAVLGDFEKHVVPDFTVVPAGVAAVQLAQQHGFTLFALG